MGQYWNVVNLDKMEALDNMGKLGESLWEEQRDLVEKIAQANIPPPPGSKTRKRLRTPPLDLGRYVDHLLHLRPHLT